MLNTVTVPNDSNNSLGELVRLSLISRSLDQREARRQKRARQAMAPDQRREVDQRKEARQKRYRDCVLGAAQQQPETDYARAKAKVAALRSPAPVSDFRMAQRRLQQLGWKR